MTNASDTLPAAIPSVNRERRYFLIRATLTVGSVGAALTAWPLISSWWPSAKGRAFGGPVKVRLDRVEAGSQVAVPWRGRPVWVLHRSPAMLRRLSSPSLIARLRDPYSTVRSQQPAYAENPLRSIRPDFLVVVGVCTHLGCIPDFRPETAPKDLGPNWIGGYFCPCHGSKFDFAGRVFKAVPAPTNLVIPPHRHFDDVTAEVGVDEAQA